MDNGITVSMYFMNSSSYQVHRNIHLKYSVALLWIASFHPTKEVRKRPNTLCPDPFSLDGLFLRALGHCPDKSPLLLV